MPVSIFALAQLLHVLSAAITLGGLVALPAIALEVHGAGDSRFARYGLAIMRRLELTVIAPATLGVVAFGLAMVEGPLARFSFTAPGSGWLHVGTTLWTLLALALYGLARARGALQAKADEGATGGEPVRDRWRAWTAALSVAVLCLAGGVAAMVFKLGA